jgi:hypothetical protein
MNRPLKPAMIRAELVGTTAIAGTVSTRGNTPILDLCRALVDAGVDPAAPLHAYRGATLALRVRTIGAGAKLTVKEGNHDAPRLAKWEPYENLPQSRRVSSRIAPIEISATRTTPRELRPPSATPDGSQGRAA